MVTIRDVARRAGVSIATVSRSLNNQDRVSAATRERVLTAAAELDYRPSQAARGLVTGRLDTIGVVLPDVTNGFFTPILAGIEHHAQERGLGVLLADSREDANTERELVRRMSQLVDGLVLVASRMPDAEILEYVQIRPTVLAGRVVEGVDAIAVDSGVGTDQILTNLAELGHRDVLYLHGPRQSWAGERRVAAVRRAAERLGVRLHESEPMAPNFAAGRAATEYVLAQQVTAVIAYDDLIAWGLLTGLEDAGIAVPDRLSVAGCDDALQTGMSRPALTTVTADLDRIGTTAAELLFDRIADPGAPVRTAVLGSSAVLRDSTGPVPV